MDVRKLNTSLPASKTEEVSSSETNTPPSASKEINVGISSTKDSVEAVQNSASSFVSEIAEAGGALDPNALVQYVLRESYVQTTEDLRYFADKVKYFNECKKDVREYLEKMKGADSTLKEEFRAIEPGQSTNVIEAATEVIKQSVEEDNETKKYYLDVLGNMNKINSYVSENQRQIDEVSSRLTVKKKDDDDP